MKRCRGPTGFRCPKPRWRWMLSFNSLDAIALFGAHLETFAAPARNRPSGILMGCWGWGEPLDLWQSLTVGKTWDERGLSPPFFFPDCVFGRSYQSGNEEICSKTAAFQGLIYSRFRKWGLEAPTITFPLAVCGRSVAPKFHSWCHHLWRRLGQHLHRASLFEDKLRNLHTHTQSEKITIHCFLITIQYFGWVIYDFPNFRHWRITSSLYPCCLWETWHLVLSHSGLMIYLTLRGNYASNGAPTRDDLAQQTLGLYNCFF